MDGEIRFVGGMRWDNQNRSLEGRVEYCNAEQWGTVCDNNFDNFDARVVCRQAGFSLSKHTLQSTLYISHFVSLFQMVPLLTVEVPIHTDKLPLVSPCI